MSRVITPIRIQRSRQHKQVSPNGLPIVYVGRPTKWGNRFEVREMKDKTFGLFRHGKHCGLYGLRIDFYHTKEEAVKEAIRLFESGISSSDILMIKKELKGKNLSCWCKSGELCHADILLKIANQ